MTITVDTFYNKYNKDAMSAIPSGMPQASGISLLCNRNSPNPSTMELTFPKELVFVAIHCNISYVSFPWGTQSEWNSQWLAVTDTAEMDCEWSNFNN